MSEQIRVGVIGTGLAAQYLHLPGLKSHPGAHLSAICGRDRNRAAEMAAKYEIPAVYTDYHEMIAKAGLDAVVVATPDDLHYPMTMAALEAGLHVLCEKPLAYDAAQARAMYQKAEAAGVQHMVFFTYPWQPHYRYIHQLLADGYVGHPRHCQMSYVGGYGRTPAYGWRFDAQRANGALGDLGSHLIQFARQYVGEIARVSAHLATFVAREGPDGQALAPANDASVLAVEFANGAHGTLQVSAVADIAKRGQEQHLVLYGETGTLESRTFSGSSEISGARSGSDRSGSDHFETLQIPDEYWGDVPRDDFFAIFQRQAVGGRLFVDAIREGKVPDGRMPFPTFYDGLRVQQVIDAALASHREGRWMAVEEE